MGTDRPFLPWGERTFLMGVVNMTPDSFTGDGLLASGVDVARRIGELLAAGADIVDIGGESTRPGFVPVPAGEEIRRVLPALEATRSLGATTSIDTQKADVARAALEAGASMINDISSLADRDMPSVAAATRGAMLVILHNEKLEAGKPAATQVARGLARSVERAMQSGVRPEQIIVDPGLGFGKSWRDNLEIIRDLHQLRNLGFPVLVGPSRKGTISKVLGVSREERLEGTLALVVLCIAHGADIVRVHDVAVMSRAARMADVLVRVEDA